MLIKTPHRFIGLTVAALLLSQAAHAGSLSPTLSQLVARFALSPRAAVIRTRRTSPAALAMVFSAHVDAGGAVQVYIHYRSGEAPGQAALQALGASGIESALGVTQAWVPIGRLQQVARMHGVTRLGLPAYAIVRGQSLAGPRASTCGSVPSGLDIDAGGIAAENIQALQSAGVTGSGVKVGIISNGVDCMSSSQNQGYLPQNVWTDSSLTGNGSEGVAMLEEIHAAAPGAQLGFCGPNTTVEFITCYDDLAAWGADVIADDLGFPTSFFFNDPTGDAFTQAVGQFAQDNPGISLVTAAGNDSEDYFQADYAPSSATSPIALSPTGYTPEPGGTTGRQYQSVMDIGGESYQTVNVTAASSATVNFLLTWDDPKHGPYDDLDLFLLDANNNILDASTFDQTADATVAPGSASWMPPEEYVQYTNNSGTAQTLKLVVMCYVCDQTQTLLVKLGGTLDAAGSFAHVTAGGLYGQAALDDELTAAAAYLDGKGNNHAHVELFSERGPYVGGDWLNGTSMTWKPDLAAIDGVTVSGAGGFSSPFYGTSAASPNVAAVIALLRSEFAGSNYSAAQWKKLVMAAGNQGRVNTSPPNAIGSGLVDARASAALYQREHSAAHKGGGGGGTIGFATLALLMGLAALARRRGS